MTKPILLKIWRAFPLWLQARLSRVVRPLFQVFAVAVIFNQQNQILLVKTTYNRTHPWGLPGGSLDYGESPEGAAIREMLEETGLSVVIEKFLLVKSWLPDRVGFYYLCKIIGNEFHPSDEVSEIGYFSEENLPDVRPVDVAMIKELFGMMEHELA
jgi:ADP-ribose pyrophosphatase YjhB (NUDIX family)